MDISNIDYLGLDRVLRRGSGEIIEEQDRALLVRDSVSGALMLASEDASAGSALLDRYAGRDCNLLLVTDRVLGEAAYEKYGFSEKLECYQVAYYGEKPSPDAGLAVRAADLSDLPVLTEHYRLISPEEMESLVRRGSVLLGYYENELVGFIGEHLEGSMGLLYVLPEYRRRGFGSELEKHLIARTMEEGYTPFGQVVRDNRDSLELQKKIGMTQSENIIVWMWRESNE